MNGANKSLQQYLAIKRTRLNQHHTELQSILADSIEGFCQTVVALENGRPLYFMKHGMLSEICSKTPFLIYDLESLSRRLSTAFTDGLRVYFQAKFFEALLAESENVRKHFVADIVNEMSSIESVSSADLQEITRHPNIVPVDPVEFLIAHELEHIRRIHCQRMLDFPQAISIIAQDIRINGDLYMVMTDRWLSDLQLMHLRQHQIFEKIVATVAKVTNKYSSILKSGAGTSPEDILKWMGKSEEEIAASILRDYQSRNNNHENGDKDADNQRKISFPDLCKAVVHDLRDIEANAASIAGSEISPGQASRIANKINNLNQKKTEMPTTDLESLRDELFRIANTVDMVQRNARHEAVIRNGLSSVDVDDKFIGKMLPSNRMELLASLIDMKLGNLNNANADQADMTITVKDLIAQGFGGNTDAHTMSPEELGNELMSNGLNNVAEALGYDDPQKIKKMANETQSSVIQSIDKSANDKRNIGSRYPGGHLVDYAVQKKSDFFKPKINWRFVMRDLFMGKSGKEFYKDMLEPNIATMSMINDPESFGLSSEDDVLWDGNYLTASREKGVVAVILDASGSMFSSLKNGEQIMHRMASEIVHMVRENEHNETSPEVILVCSDTVARGQPQIITQEDYDDFLRNGIEISGGGGTNLERSICDVMSWNREGGPLEGRQFDGLLIFTDSFDQPPKIENIMNSLAEHQELPPIVWLVPNECHTDQFERAVEGYSTYIRLNLDDLAASNEVDLNKAAENHIRLKKRM